MKRSRVKAKAIDQEKSFLKALPLALLLLLSLLLITLATRAEDPVPNPKEISETKTEDEKSKDCNSRCDGAKKQCTAFCEEAHEDDDAKSCTDKCDFVFDGYCKDSCKSDEKFSFTCQDEEANSDDMDCIEGCESHYATVALNCNEKFKDDSRARQKCFENASSLVDDTGFCYSTCATDPTFACETK